MFLKLRFTLIITCIMSIALSAQVGFPYPIHTIDVDILERDHSCFTPYTKAEVETVLLLDLCIKKFDFADRFKIVGVMNETDSEGLFVVINKRFYPIMPSTSLSIDQDFSRFLLMQHARTNHIQLIQYNGKRKHGTSFDVYDDTFYVHQFQRNLPYGTQCSYDIMTGEQICQEATIVPIVDWEPPMYQDTFSTINRTTMEQNIFIVQRRDSTSVLRKLR